MYAFHPSGPTDQPFGSHTPRREQRVRQLLSHEEMGDRKPSQFLRHLKSLAPDIPDEFLRTIWASRLQHVQAILAGQTGQSGCISPR